MNKEILFVVESISNEKNVDKEIIFQAIERALVTVTKRKYIDAEIRVVIDRVSGDYETFRYWTVVANEQEQEFPSKQLTLEQAKQMNPEVEVGDTIEIPVESIKYGRILAQLAKQIITGEIRKAEHSRQVEHFRKYVDTLVTGTVKRVTREYILLDMGDGIEGVLRMEDVLPRENWRVQDKVRAILTGIKNDGARDPLLLLSRTCNSMLRELFKIEVPEIAEDLIVIKSVARDPGLRSKVAVKSNDGRIDPIGACIGIRGARIQAISNELNGEHVDVVIWDDNPAQLVVNAMVPAQIASIVVDEASKQMTLAVKEEHLAQAIGRNGQNVKLASELTGWRLEVISTDEFAARADKEQGATVAEFVDKLNVDQELAQLLVQEGFRTLEDLAYAPIKDLSSIEGLDKDAAKLLKDRASNILLQQALSGGDSAEGSSKPSDAANSSNEASDLASLPNMNSAILQLLNDHDINNCEDLAEQAVDDILEFASDLLDRDAAAQLIMAARSKANWF